MSNIDFTVELDAKILEMDARRTPIVMMRAELGLSHRQLIERRKKLGLPLRDQRASRAAGEVLKKKRKDIVERRVAVTEQTKHRNHEPKVKTYLSISPGFDGKLGAGDGCSYILKSGGFCGAQRKKKQPGRRQSPYCEEHHARCHQRPGRAEDLSEVYLGPRSSGVGSAIVR